MNTPSAFEATSARGPRPGIPRRAFLAGLVPAALALGAFARRGPACPPCSPTDPPLFRLVPDPPSAGKDVDVTYLGDNPDFVIFQIGPDGEQHVADIGPDHGFEIPRELLKAGQRLCLRDQLAGAKGDHCVLIEP